MGILERHARYYLYLIESNTDDWQRIENELGQIRQAWDWTSKQPSALLLPYVWAMHRFFEQRALWREAIAWYERGIAVARPEDQMHDLGALWSNSGAAHYALNDWGQARECYARAQKIFGEIEDPACQAKVLNGLGLIAQAEGKRSEALSQYERALEFFHAENDPLGEATVLHNAGQVYAEMQDYDQAFSNYENALAIRRKKGDQVAVALTLNNLAAALQTQLDSISRTDRKATLARAIEYQSEARDIFAVIGYRFYHAVALGNLSILAQYLSDFKEALALGEQALHIFRELGDSAREASTLSNLGGILDSLGEYERAHKYQLRAAELFEALGRLIDQATVFDNIAASFEAQNNSNEALAYRQKALEMWHGLNNSSEEANTLAALGKMFLQRREFPKASRALEQARILLEGTDNHAHEAIILNDLALAYQFQEKQYESRSFYERALSLAIKLGDRDLIDTVSHNLARLKTDAESADGQSM